MSITETPVETTDTDPAATETTLSSNGDEMVVEELLVEEVSIDGMCGVY